MQNYENNVSNGIIIFCTLLLANLQKYVFVYLQSIKNLHSCVIMAKKCAKTTLFLDIICLYMNKISHCVYSVFVYNS